MTRLVLDIGGVLIDHDDDALAARLCRLLGHDDKAAILAAFRDSGLGVGRRRPETAYEALAPRLGAAIDVAAFRRVWTSHFTAKPDMLAFARDWASRAPLVLCSNTDAVHWEFACASFALDKLGPAVLSHECGLAKPDPAIYRLAAKAHGVAPEQCLFVDDKEAYVEAAKAVGMRGHRFDGLDGLIAALNTGA